MVLVCCVGACTCIKRRSWASLRTDRIIAIRVPDYVPGDYTFFEHPSVSALEFLVTVTEWIQFLMVLDNQDVSLMD